jgi:hypothetical protein
VATLAQARGVTLTGVGSIALLGSVLFGDFVRGFIRVWFGAPSACPEVGTDLFSRCYDRNGRVGESHADSGRKPSGGDFF